FTCIITYFLFFFQAEDGIRDFHVTGVQTCALPILVQTTTNPLGHKVEMVYDDFGNMIRRTDYPNGGAVTSTWEYDLRWSIVIERSEERRVGKECSGRDRWCNVRTTRVSGAMGLAYM